MEENEKHRIEATKVQSDGKAIKTEKKLLVLIDDGETVGRGNGNSRQNTYAFLH